MFYEKQDGRRLSNVRFQTKMSSAKVRLKCSNHTEPPTQIPIRTPSHLLNPIQSKFAEHLALNFALQITYLLPNYSETFKTPPYDSISRSRIQCSSLAASHLANAWFLHDDICYVGTLTYLVEPRSATGTVKVYTLTPIPFAGQFVHLPFQSS